MKKSVGILIGGKSVEHEVSIITGLQVYDNIDKEKYNPIVIYVSRDGTWFIGESLCNIDTYKNKNFKNVDEVIPFGEDNKLVLINRRNLYGKFFYKKKKNIAIDIVFPAVHGTNCEDGTIHGLCRMYNIPCCFGSVLSSSIGMDKIIMKKIFKSDNLPVVDYVYFSANEFEDNENEIIDKIESLGYPLIIKPSNLGSSIGISKAKNKKELLFAIEVALSYDNRILVENCIENVREINCAVLGFDNYLVASQLEEPLGWKDFLTFEDKYIGGEKNNFKEKRRIPADLDQETTLKIKEYAKKAFKAIDCSGNSRIDFLYDGNNIYINEINTIPGSIAFYMWEYSKLSFSSLISKIIDIAEITNNERIAKIVNYDIDLLNSMAKNGKIKIENEII